MRDALKQEAEAVVTLADSLDESHMTAVEWILKCKGRVITCGVGKSGHIARKTAGTLSSTGTPSLFLHAAEAVHGDLGMVTEKDVVLLYSHSGETSEIVDLFIPLKAIGAKTILMTGRPESTGGRTADLAINTFVREEACPNNLAPTTSTTAMIALSDAIAIAVMKLRNFTAGDFAKFHPSGTLGKRLLLRISDVMRTGQDLALVKPEEPIMEVMRAITRAGAGAACVIDGQGQFLGIISDGDLRRHLLKQQDPFNGVAKDIMTANATTLNSDLLAVEALEVFQTASKIGEIPVLEGQKVIGLLVLKDLMRSGIV